MYDALRCSFLSVKKPPRRPNCPVCGPQASIHDIWESRGELLCTRGPTGVSDQVEATAATLSPTTLSPERNVSCSEYQQLRLAGVDHLLLDVRVKKQFEMCSIEGSINIPLAQLKDGLQRVEEMSKGQKPIYCLCRRGIASTEATKILQEAISTTHPQIHSVYNITGGLQAWKRQVDDSFPNY